MFSHGRWPRVAEWPRTQISRRPGVRVIMAQRFARTSADGIFIAWFIRAARR